MDGRISYKEYMKKSAFAEPFCAGDFDGDTVVMEPIFKSGPARTAKIFLDNGIGYEVEVTEINKEHLSPYRPITINVKGGLNKIFVGVQDCIPSSNGMPYKKIIFNDPATIVIWKDGTKTIVKCQPGEMYDKEKGVAMCFMKKAMGNKGNFNDVFRDCGALEEESNSEVNIAVGIAEGLSNALNQVKDALSLVQKNGRGDE